MYLGIYTCSATFFFYKCMLEMRATKEHSYSLGFVLWNKKENNVITGKVWVGATFSKP